MREKKRTISDQPLAAVFKIGFEMVNNQSKLHSAPKQRESDPGIHLTDGCPSFYHAGGIQVRPSILKNSQSILKNLIIDNVNFGHGVEIGGKYKARFANPQSEPPELHNPRTHRLEYRTIGNKKLQQHIGGERPYFMVNVSTRRVEGWSKNGLFLLVDAAIGFDKGQVDPVTVDDFIDAMMSDQPPLSINQARNFAKAKSGKDSMLGTDILAKLKCYLCYNGCINQLTKRLLGRAITVNYIPVYEYWVAVDIDGKPGYECSAAHSITLAHRLKDQIFAPAGIATYIETSRNRDGAYVWLKFQLEQLTDRPFEDQITEFNDLLAKLIERCEQVQHDDLVAHVCKIGGTVAQWEFNTKFDPNKFHHIYDKAKMSHGEGYLWRKHHHDIELNRDGSKVKWTYKEEFEERILHGVDEITFPLHNLAADKDGGKERVRRCMVFSELPATPVSQLRTCLGVTSPIEQTKPHPSTGRVKKLPRLPSKSPVVTPQFPAESADWFAQLTATYGHNANILTFLDRTKDEHARFVAAAFMVIRKHHGDPDAAFDETLALVKLGGCCGWPGPATDDPDDTPERLDHVQRCLAFAAKHYDPTKVGKGCNGGQRFLFTGANASQTHDVIIGMAAQLKARIPQSLIDEIETAHPYARPLKDELLGAAYCIMLSNMHTGNLQQVPRNSLLSGLRLLGYPINKATAAAVTDLFTHPQAGLLMKVLYVTLDDDGNVLERYEWANGQCRKYALRATAIIPQEWHGRTDLQYGQGEVTVTSIGVTVNGNLSVYPSESSLHSQNVSVTEGINDTVSNNKMVRRYRGEGVIPQSNTSGSSAGPTNTLVSIPPPITISPHLIAMTECECAVIAESSTSIVEIGANRQEWSIQWRGQCAPT